MHRHVAAHTNTHTSRLTHYHQMLYLFVGVFKLISLSPGENGNCLPGVKVDDKGIERGGRSGGRERYRNQVGHRCRVKVMKKEGCLNMFKMHVFTQNFMRDTYVGKKSIKSDFFLHACMFAQAHIERAGGGVKCNIPQWHWQYCTAEWQRKWVGAKWGHGMTQEKVKGGQTI